MKRGGHVGEPGGATVPQRSTTGSARALPTYRPSPPLPMMPAASADPSPAFSFSSLTKAFEPERAIVPRLETNSVFVIPRPVVGDREGGACREDARLRLVEKQDQSTQAPSSEPSYSVTLLLHPILLEGALSQRCSSPLRDPVPQSSSHLYLGASESPSPRPW